VKNPFAYRTKLKLAIRALDCMYGNGGGGAALELE
jgi:hypothetical protein